MKDGPSRADYPFASLTKNVITQDRPQECREVGIGNRNRNRKGFNQRVVECRGHLRAKDNHDDD